MNDSVDDANDDEWEQDESEPIEEADEESQSDTTGLDYKDMP